MQPITQLVHSYTLYLSRFFKLFTVNISMLAKLLNYIFCLHSVCLLDNKTISHF